jgi:hypothetical protein
MAKKDDIDLDNDFDFDDFEDFDDFNVDPPKDDRNPIVKTGVAVIKGAAEGVASETFLREFTRAAMPPGYSEAFDLVSDVKNRTSSLYNEARTKLKPAIRDAKKAVNAVMPAAEKLLPKRLAEKIKAAVAPEKEFSNQQATAQDSEITGTLASIFDAQVQLAEADKNRQEAEAVIKDRRDSKRHEESVVVLQDIRDAAARLVGYQDNVLSKFQRKSLELQYRQFFATRDLLAVTQSTAKATIDELKAIAKNTGLPDYVKIHSSEAFKQAMRDKLIGRFTDSAAEFSRNFREKVFKNISERVMSNVNTFKDSFSAAAQMGDDLSSMNEMMADAEEMGMGGGRTEMAGNFAGGMLGQWLGIRAGRKLRKYTESHDKTVATGADLLYKVRNSPQLLSEWAKSPTDYMSKYGMLTDLAKSVIPIFSGPGAEVTNAGTADVVGNAFFDNQTHRSINEVIPGYLSRIYQTMEGIRTGEMPDRVVYNHERNAFTSYKQSVGDIKRRLIAPQELEYFKKNVDATVDRVDGDKKLSPEARKALADQLSKDAYANKRFDPTRMVTDDGYHSSIDTAVRDELKEHFRNAFDLDDDGKMREGAKPRTFLNEVDRYYKDVINSMPNPYSRVNLYANTGQREQLRSLGLLNRVGLQDTVDGAWMSRVLADHQADTLDYDGVETDRPTDTLRQRGGKGRASKAEIAAFRTLAEELKKLREQGISSGLSNGQNGPLHTGNGAPGGPAAGPGATPTPVPPPPQAGGAGGVSKWEETINSIVDGTDRTTQEIRSFRDALMSATGGTNELLVKVVEASAIIADLIPTAGSGSAGTRGGNRRSVGQMISGGLAGIIDKGLWLGGKGLGAIWRGTGHTAKGAWWVTKKLAGLPLAVASGTIKYGQKLMEKSPLNWLREKKEAIKGAIDLRAADGRILIEKARLAAGEYRDAITGEVIKRVQDIKGQLLDPDGKVVLTIEDIKKGLFTEEGRRVYLKHVGDIIHGIDGRVRGSATFRRIRNLWNWDAEKICDVYIRDKPDLPVMQAVDIQQGKYRDKKSGRVIKTIGDIEGAVVDWDNNLVLTDEQYSDGLFDHKGKRLNRNVVGRAFGAAVGLVKGGLNISSLMMKPMQWMAKKAKSGLRSILVPFDVYVKGETSPRLLARLIRAGQYICKSTGKTVVLYSDIEGPIVHRSDPNGNELVTLAEVTAGLVDRFGRPIEGIPKRLVKLGVEAGIKAIRMVGKVGKWALDKSKGAWDVMSKGLGKFTSYLREHWIGSTEEVKRSNSLLEKIYELLDERLPGGGKRRRKGRKGRGAAVADNVKLDQNGNPVGKHDSDGDGDRDGSWRDILANKAKNAKDKAKALIEKVKAPKGKGLLGMLSTLTAGIGSLISAIATFNPLKFLTKIPGLGKLGKLAAGAWGGMKALGLGIAGRATAGGVMGTLGKGIGAVGRFVGRNILWRGLTWAAFGLASVVSTPVLAVGAVVAGAAIGGYLLYKYLTKENKLTRLRALQYGIDPDDNDQVGPVAKLEEIFGPHVTVNRVGDLKVEGEPDMKQMLEPFGIDPQNDGDVARFAQWTVWFKDRFKPVYCKHRIELGTRVPEADIGDVDKVIKPEYKLPFARGTMITTEPSPYNVTHSPFGDQPLPVGTEKIRALISEIEKEFGQKEIKTDKGTYRPALQGLTVPNRFAGNSAADEAARRTLEGLSKDEYLTEDEAKRQRDKLGTVGAGTVTWSTLPVNRIDEITSIRFRVYGMSKLLVSHTNALMSFEKDVMDMVDLGAGKDAVFSGDQITIYEKYASLFNRLAGNEADRTQWTYWMMNRFLPTFLAYVGMVRKLVPGGLVSEAWKNFKPEQKLQVAEALANVRVKIKDDEVSVWKIEAGPFPDLEVNTNPESIKPILDALRKAVLDKKVEESFKTDAQKKAEAEVGKLVKGKNLGIAPGTGPLMPTGNGNQVGFLDGMMGGLAASAGGQPVAAIVTGSGGKASDITAGTAYQKLASNASRAQRWDAVKDIITQAARMAGVDPALMAAIAGVESNMNPNAGASTSSAKGLYQFTKSTWAETLQKHGMKYNLPSDADPMDPVANALMGAEFLKDNMAYFERRMGRRPSDYELYMMHFLGAGGGVHFLKSPMTAMASDALVDKGALSANKPIFYTESGRMRTVAEVTQEVQRRMEANGRPYGRLASTYVGTGQTPISPMLERPTEPEGTAAPAAPAMSVTTMPAVPGSAPVAPAKVSPLPDMTPVKPDPSSGYRTTVNVPGAGDAGIAAPSVTTTASMIMPVSSPVATIPTADPGTKQRERAIRDQEVRQQRQQQIRQAQEAEVSRMTTEQAIKVETVLNQQLEVQKTMVVKLDEVVKELRAQSKQLKASQQAPAQASTPAKPVRQTRDALPREPVVDMRSR